jgi:hypothetical protein
MTKRPRLGAGRPIIRHRDRLAQKKEVPIVAHRAQRQSLQRQISDAAAAYAEADRAEEVGAQQRLRRNQLQAKVDILRAATRSGVNGLRDRAARYVDLRAEVDDKRDLLRSQPEELLAGDGWVQQVARRIWEDAEKRGNQAIVQTLSELWRRDWRLVMDVCYLLEDALRKVVNGPSEMQDHSTAEEERPPDRAPELQGLELIPGGFSYRGTAHELTGRPLKMLKALLAAKHHRLTTDQLRERMEIDDAEVCFPEQVVKDAAKELRKALKSAAALAGESGKNHLTSTGRGADLTYILNIS